MEIFPTAVQKDDFFFFFNVKAYLGINSMKLKQMA